MKKTGREEEYEEEEELTGGGRGRERGDGEKDQELRVLETLRVEPCLQMFLVEDDQKYVSILQALLEVQRHSCVCTQTGLTELFDHMSWENHANNTLANMLTTEQAG